MPNTLILIHHYELKLENDCVAKIACVCLCVCVCVSSSRKIRLTKLCLVLSSVLGFIELLNYVQVITNRIVPFPFSLSSSSSPISYISSLFIPLFSEITSEQVFEIKPTRLSALYRVFKFCFTIAK